MAHLRVPADLAEHAEHLGLQGRVFGQALGLFDAALDQLDRGDRPAGGADAVNDWLRTWHDRQPAR